MATRTEDVKPVQNLDDESIRAFYRNLAAARSNSQSAAGECGAILKEFEKNGGNKKALTLYHQLDKMGEEKAQDFLRSLMNILRVFGVHVGPDMVDMMELPQSEVPAKPQKKVRASKSVQARVSRIKEKAIQREADKAANDIAKPAEGFSGFAH